MACVLLGLWIYAGLAPKYVSPDGVGYLAYLISIVSDADLDFENEFRSMHFSVPLAVTETGYIANIWPPGTALFLSPFYLAAWVIHALLHPLIGMPVRAWCIVFANAGSTLYGVAAVWMACRFLRSLGLTASQAPACAAAVFAGTPLCYYTIHMPNSPYPVSAFAVSLFLSDCLKSSNTKDPRWDRWAWRGILLGLAATIRTENLLFGVVPVADWIARIVRESGRKREIAAEGLVFAVGGLIGFSPQLAVWQILYGSVLNSPQGFNIGFHNFALYEVIFSPFHGVVPWTPIVVMGLAGFFCRGASAEQRIALALSVGIQILLISFTAAWWGGHAFGPRVLTGGYFAICVGVSLMIQTAARFGRRAEAAVWAAIAIVSGWTFSLSLQSMIGWINLTEIVTDGRTLLAWQARAPRALAEASLSFGGAGHLSAAASAVAFAILGMATWSLARFSKRLLAEGPARRRCVIAGVLILVVHVAFLAADRNRPDPGLRNRAAYSDPAKLSNFFLDQAHRIRLEYDQTRSGRPVR